jgi:hypothetical protein
MGRPTGAKDDLRPRTYPTSQWRRGTAKGWKSNGPGAERTALNPPDHYPVYSGGKMVCMSSLVNNPSHARLGVPQPLAGSHPGVAL